MLDDGTGDDLTEALTASTGITHDDLKSHLDLHYGDAAVAHVFNVAAGLDSMAVGEAQIVGQVRRAAETGDTVASFNLAFKAIGRAVIHGTYQH